MNMKNVTLLERKQKQVIYIAAIISVIAVMTALAYYVGRPLVKHMNEPELFKKWLGEFGIYPELMFVLLIVFQVVVAVIPGEPFEIFSGYAFGFVKGSILCLTGITLGSVIIFLLVRRLGRGIIEVFFKPSTIDKIAFLKDPKKMNLITFLIFAIPGTPKDLLTYAVGLTPIALKSWIVICFLARIPSVVSSAYAGHLLGEEQYAATIVVFAVMTVISAAGMYIYSRYIENNGK